MSKLKEKIDPSFERIKGMIYQKLGSNYLQILIRDMQAPYFI